MAEAPTTAAAAAIKAVVFVLLLAEILERSGEVRVLPAAKVLVATHDIDRDRSDVRCTAHANILLLLLASE